MFCSTCGTQLPDGSRLCTMCGVSVSAPTPRPEALRRGGSPWSPPRLVAIGGVLAAVAVLAVLGVLFVPSFWGGGGDGGTAPSASMFRGNAARTGESPGPGPKGAPRLRWHFQTAEGVSNPVVVDGVVYVGSTDGYLYAVNAMTGEERWRSSLGSSDVAVMDGLVFVAGSDGNLFALDAGTGQERWRFQAPFPILPALIEEGDIASRTIHSPRDVTLESELLTERARELAAAAVPEVTELDANVRSTQLATLTSTSASVTEVRENAALDDAEKRARLRSISALGDLSRASIDAVLALSDDRWERVRQEADRVLGDAMSGAIGPDDVQAEQAEVVQRIAPDLTADGANLVVDLVRPLIVATLTIDEQATREAREQAREQVEPLQVSIAANEVIVEAGQPIDSLALEILEHLGLLAQLAERDGAIQIHGTVTAPGVVESVVFFGSFGAAGGSAETSGETAGYIYAVVASSGLEQWRSPVDGDGYLAPLAASEGLVYVSTLHGIRALDIATGVERWHKTLGSMLSMPTIRNGNAYAVSEDGSFYVLSSETGWERWRRSSVAASALPAVTESVVYLVSDDSYVYALDAANGEERWRFKAEDYEFAIPTVADGVVYVGSRNLVDTAPATEQGGALFAIDASNGEELWRFNTEGEIYSSPVVVDGIVYIGRGDGLYAIEGSDER